MSEKNVPAKAKWLTEERVRAIYDALVENADRKRKGYKTKTINQIAEEHGTTNKTVQKVKNGSHRVLQQMQERGELNYQPLAMVGNHTQRAELYRESTMADLKRMVRAGLITKEASKEAAKEIMTEYNRLCRMSLYQRRKQAPEAIARAKAKMRSLEGMARSEELKKEMRKEARQKAYCKRIENVAANLVTAIAKEEISPKSAKKMMFSKFRKEEAQSYWDTAVEVLAEQGIEVAC
ncbi:hypothetical protein [uncultured Endozoicomonas sp.]|uniref:hypothetical protein n=1 Tax=uncultured Endozoicomonas sp. TaxID=432652 RepID=UPI0026043D16|nr:hypothetical protein [uncultured Endozoicomonas sp.]